MPELPEVETTRRGVEPHLLRRQIQSVLVRDARLRWPIAETFGQDLTGRTITAVERRAKYLLIKVERPSQTGRTISVNNTSADASTLMIHLGMSGSLRIVAEGTPPSTHDHVDLNLDSGKVLRFHDPRRFGSMFFVAGAVSKHPLLADLGPEPLSATFDGEHLFTRSRNRRQAIKPFLMDAHIVVGVGNIYANEALYFAGIRPDRPAGRVSRSRYLTLGQEIKRVLEKAILAGGTTLRDFVREDGSAGYFSQALHVYGRGGEPCKSCGRSLREIVLGQRATVFCTRCQR